MSMEVEQQQQQQQQQQEFGHVTCHQHTTPAAGEDAGTRVRHGIPRKIAAAAAAAAAGTRAYIIAVKAF
jgi:hypothetical protein